MPGFTTTGGNTNDYNLGRGIVYFDGDGVLDSNGNLIYARGFRDLGNCTEFNISVETETLEHQSYLESLKTIDKELVLSQKMTVSFTLDELNMNNLSLFFLGSPKGSNGDGTALLNAQQAASDTASKYTGTVLATGRVNQYIENIAPGVWYDLKMTSDTGITRRAYDFEATQTFTVVKSPTDRTTASGTAVPAAQYEIDRKMGRWRAIVGGGLVAGDDILIKWADPAVANAALTDSNLEMVAGLGVSGKEGALRFIQVNPVNADHQTEYTFHNVLLRPEGDFNLLSDEISTITLTGTVQAVSSAPYGGSKFVDIVTSRAYST